MWESDYPNGFFVARWVFALDVTLVGSVGNFILVRHTSHQWQCPLLPTDAGMCPNLSYGGSAVLFVTLTSCLVTSGKITLVSLWPVT